MANFAYDSLALAKSYLISYERCANLGIAIFAMQEDRTVGADVTFGIRYQAGAVGGLQ